MFGGGLGEQIRKKIWLRIPGNDDWTLSERSADPAVITNVFITTEGPNNNSNLVYEVTKSDGEKTLVPVSLFSRMIQYRYDFKEGDKVWIWDTDAAPYARYRPGVVTEVSKEPRPGTSEERLVLNVKITEPMEEGRASEIRIPEPNLPGGAGRTEGWRNARFAEYNALENVIPDEDLYSLPFLPAGNDQPRYPYLIQSLLGLSQAKWIQKENPRNLDIIRRWGALQHAVQSMLPEQTITRRDLASFHQRLERLEEQLASLQASSKNDIVKRGLEQLVASFQDIIGKLDIAEAQRRHSLTTLADIGASGAEGSDVAAAPSSHPAVETSSAQEEKS